jgi:hypothetical protein
VVPTPAAVIAPDAASAEATDADKAGEGESRDIDLGKIARVSRLPWALLLKRVFGFEIVCSKCHARATRGHGRRR